MPSVSTLRLRRSAAQLHALAQVEREIRATDPHVRRKYLRDYTEAYRSYESVLLPTQLEALYDEANVLLVGDYHALPASQRFAARLLRQLAATKPAVLGVETVFARDQHILDEWQRREIDGSELRDRIRFDLDWGYEWAPFYELLLAAREAGVPVYGLDCMPRGDLRRIHTRDRHAAGVIADLRERHPEAAVVAIFGESHLAPTHLPRELRSRRTEDRVLTVLQNVDELYWQAAGERSAVSAVRVRDDVVCLFHCTPLEKYESYRLCIERWRQERPRVPDLAPTFYNIIEALLRTLGIDQYAGPEPLVDALPEVCCRASEEQFRKLLARKRATEPEIAQVLTALDTQDAIYLPRLNTLFLRGFDMQAGALEAGRFIHAACRGLLGRTTASGTDSGANAFYRDVLERALAEFGARVMHPVRPPARESDLYTFYSLDREAAEEVRLGTFREFMQTIDFLVLHKDYESSALHYREVPELIIAASGWTGRRRAFVVEKLGAMLGSELHEGYVHGRVGRRFVRSLFSRSLERDARTTYFVVARRIRKPKRRLVS